MEELKPCPFCNSEAKIDKCDTFYAIVCQNYNCGAEINSFKLKEVAIERWNSRVEKNE